MDYLDRKRQNVQNVEVNRKYRVYPPAQRRADNGYRNQKDYEKRKPGQSLDVRM